MAEQARPASMESLGPDSRLHRLSHQVYVGDLVDCETAIEREIAEEDASLAAQDIADQVVLDAIDRAAVAPPKEAERIVAEARRVADAYIAEHLPSGWRRVTTLAPFPVLVRARKREPCSRRTRRVRVRSGSRGDPPGADESELDPVPIGGGW